MKIKYIKGDLFNTDCEYILHGCNAQGVMGSGVAKIVKERYPEAYNQYAAWCQSRNYDVLGHALFVRVGLVTIINAVTQDNFGRHNDTKYVSYDAVDRIFKDMNHMFNGEPIAMPMVGAGLGGGSWDVISTIIEHRAINYQPIVYQI